MVCHWKNANMKVDCLVFNVQELVRMNQKHLDFLGVSHPTIDTICRVAHKHRLSAKLTGAGGGGCAFVLLHCGEFKLLRVNLSCTSTITVSDQQKHKPKH